MICRDFYTSITFDGNGDYIDVADDPRIKPVTDFAMGAWIYMTSPAPSGQAFTAISMGAHTGLNQGCFLRVRPGQNIEYLQGTGSTFSSQQTAARLAPRTWYHFAVVVRDSVNVTIFLNGVQIHSGTVSAPMQHGTDTVKIGARNSGGDAFTGHIDEPFIYSRALTPQEVWDIYDKGNYPEKPSLLMRFDEGFGFVARDVESGNGWAGALTGNARYTAQVPCAPPPVDRDLTGAYRGDLSGSAYVMFNGFNGALDGKAGLSVAAWVRPHQFQSGSVVVFAGLATSVGANCSLGLGNSRNFGLFARSASEAGSQVVQSPTAEVISCPTASSWTLVSGSVDYAGARLSLYVNGVLVNENTSPVFDQKQLTPASNPHFTAGSSASGVIPTAALVADAMLFGRVLTKDEHRALYLYGNPPPTDLELRWKLDDAYNQQVAIDSSGKGRNGSAGTGAAWRPNQGPFR